MKINRLTQIMLILLNKKTVTAKELAKRFEVSQRTIYRDIETLSQSGVPIYMTKGRGGGISIIEDYSINKTILSKNDRNSLALAIKALSSIEFPQANKLLEKIGFMTEKEDWIDIDLSRWGSRADEGEKFIDLKDAILNKKLIEFLYLNSIGQISSRVVEPLKLIYKGQSWYLYGYCRLKKDLRLFRISRIRNLQVKADYFEDRKINKKEIVTFNTKEAIVEIKLRVKKEIMYRVCDDVDSENITDNKDGTYEVSVEFPDGEWLYGYLLSFGSSIEVIDPIYIRRIILNKIKDMGDIYDKNKSKK